MLQQAPHSLADCKNNVNKGRDGQVIPMPRWSLPEQEGVRRWWGGEQTRRLQPMPRLSHWRCRGAASSAPGSGNRDTPSWQQETICTSSTSKMGDASASRAAFSYLWQSYKENWEDFLSWAGSVSRYLENRRLNFSFRNSSTLQRIHPAKEPKMHFCCCLSDCPSTCSIFSPLSASLCRGGSLN